MASYLLPALVGPQPVLFPRSPAPIWPCAAPDAGGRGSHGRRLWLRAHLRRRSARARNPGGAGDPRRAGVCRRPSSWSVSRCGATPRSPVRFSPPATGLACTATAIATSCASRRGRCARTSPGRSTASRTRPAIRRRSTARRTACSTPSALRVARSRGWRTLLWSQWGRDWEARATAASIVERVTDGVEEGSVLLLHDADDYSAAGLVAAHRGGAAAGSGCLSRARSAACGALSAG